MQYSSFITKLSTLVIAIVFLIANSSCTQKKNSNGVLFSGTITNTTENKIYIRSEQPSLRFQEVIPLDQKGMFSTTLKIPSKGLFSINLDRKYTLLYLKKGDELTLSTNADSFLKSIRFEGEAADANNYLTKKLIINQQLIYSYRTPETEKKLFSKEPDEFKNYIREKTKEKHQLLDSYQNLDNDFISMQHKSNHIEYLTLLDRYVGNHMRYTGKKTPLLPNGFFDEFEALDIDNEEDFENILGFDQFVFSQIQKNAFERKIKDSISHHEAIKKEISQLKSKKIKHAIVRQLSFSISTRNIESENLYEMLMKITEDQNLKDDLTDKINVVRKSTQSLAKGKASPTFSNYENYKGGTTSLEDFKGKYVYMDIWATWCGPCKAEFPNLKKLDQQYKSKNIEFVSISVDNEKQKKAWKKMIEEKELSGTQLFADNSFKSKFVQEYYISGIPRFILLDPNGIIIDANAPRPSEPRLDKILKTILK